MGKRSAEIESFQGNAGSIQAKFKKNMQFEIPALIKIFNPLIGTF